MPRLSLRCAGWPVCQGFRGQGVVPRIAKVGVGVLWKVWCERRERAVRARGGGGAGEGGTGAERAESGVASRRRRQGEGERYGDRTVLPVVVWGWG